MLTVRMLQNPRDQKSIFSTNVDITLIAAEIRRKSDASLDAWSESRRLERESEELLLQALRMIGPEQRHDLLVKSGVSPDRFYTAERALAKEDRAKARKAKALQSEAGKAKT
jgi:hypothetical protein